MISPQCLSEYERTLLLLDKKLVVHLTGIPITFSLAHPHLSTDQIVAQKCTSPTC